MTDTQHPHHDTGLFNRLKKDLSAADHIDEISREYKDFRDFYLDPKLQNRLRKMGWFRRWFYFAGWLIKSMFFKLSPTRRLLVAGGLALNINAVTLQIGPEWLSHNSFWGSAMILFVLMLELKDKSLAKDELEAGRKIQMALMPERSPEFQGWSVWLYSCPANDVGGDLVDFMKLQDTRAGITMADVAGKGLRAALLSAKLQATLRALATGQESPAELCNQINRIFHRDSIPSIFASLLYAEISSDSGTIHYVNAGHLPPFHLIDDKIQEQDKGELALGLAPKFSFTERTIELNRNELFFAYSDGLTEACNEAGEFFGLERLKLFLTKTCHLNVNTIGDLLVEEVNRFTGQARVNDDLSVIILKRK